MIKSTINKLKNIVKSGTFVPISSDPYSTHIPVLIGIIRLLKPKTIIEYGSGFNSTLLFINKEICPSIDTVRSYENYRDWYSLVKQKVDSNQSINYKYVEGDMYNYVDSNEIAQSDLVFVDDSYNAHDRSKTIEEVVKSQPKICLIHDFENQPYRKSVSNHLPYYRFKSLLPNTGCTGTHLDIIMCKEIDVIINSYKNSIQNNDINSWADVFDRLLK